MKVVFAGPSIHPSGDVRAAHPDLVWRGPARQGDVARAVGEGAVAIALIDGLYGTLATVWHKEILLALAEGVHVVGGASLGALRAVECGPFGMEGVGDVFNDYLSGVRKDDGDVALLHAPQEFDNAPMTEPLVDVDATIAAMLGCGLLSAKESGRLAHAAAGIFFWERTVEAILVRSGIPAARMDEAVFLFEDNRVRRKGADAVKVIDRLVEMPNERAARPSAWQITITRSVRRVATRSLGASGLAASLN